MSYGERRPPRACLPVSALSRADRPIDWRSRPALLLAGCLAAGILGARLVPELGFWSWMGLATGAALDTALQTLSRG